MRVAISGSHRTGKSTLLAELAERLPGYTTVDEPYHLLEEDGHELAHPPSVEDFEAQLERSIAELRDADDDTLFDRCPVDMLAYIAVHDDAEGFDLEAWLPAVRDAVATLDLVVFVPIEVRDRIALSASDDDADTRSAVDEKLREILLEDGYELGLHVVEVRGELERRVQTVLRELRPRSAGGSRRE
jgi:predicted ATPase